mmetsp:Transcript_17161/g.36874  ORF Transcript_17161/g.36874 Transcript_17161/m.36874 type:complete len:665 (+) Transcript_17161:255-2249(+)|eukprot:CAMPEP_0206488056 /NCGR_PEP_ID=MMETSP0324_2-20121206/42112_1 /ASSEMBLY_ACC=CAM_ASM_000836 /TAXON_ID=2866 /ORGANISM="Crypthecodinium cohnii, Strain Seligo" /LENGTH=664 /DNA_ID=CAMNT_0053966861 /DNA_START=191 /DNA_END=2185 /DNA_ORIENTATION=-
MGFKETFTKDQAKDDLLGYDDAAFYYFAASILVTIALPWSYYFLKATIFGVPESDEAPGKSKLGGTPTVCKTSLMMKALDEEKKKSRRTGCQFGWWLQIVILGLMWAGILFVWSEMGVEEVKNFDPFRTLEVDSSASASDIKRAYRKLSLVYHPDKNANDPAAAAKFIEITKAYNALTDPVAKANYEKFGNPDGPETTKVGIGLPKFLLEKENNLLILSCFFLVLLVLIPSVAIYYWQRTKNYASNGVLIETLQFMEHFLNETIRLKNLPEYLAASAESRQLPTRLDDQAVMTKLKKEVQEPVKPKWQHPIIVRNSLLVNAHMQRLHELLTPELQEDLELILKSSMRITQAMVEICLARGWVFSAQSVVEFRRCLVQALDIKDSPLLQIPHFDEDLIRQLNRGKGSPPTLKWFLSKPVAEQKGLQSQDPQKLLDMQAFADHLPQVELEAEVVVEDENEIVVGDIATIKVKMIRTNLKEGEAAGRVHAPFFPEAKFEEWWIVLTEPGTTGRLLGAERVRHTDRVCECKMMMQVTGKPGRRKLELQAWCDSYAGFDKKVDVNFTVVQATSANREIIVHKEDEDLDLMPTLFQQLMGDFGQMDEESEDEKEAAAASEAKPSRKERVAKAKENKKSGKAAAKESGDESEPETKQEEDAASSSASSDSE